MPFLEKGDSSSFVSQADGLCTWSTGDRSKAGLHEALAGDSDDRILGFTMIGAAAGEVMAVGASGNIGRPFRLADADLAHPTMAEGLSSYTRSVRSGGDAAGVHLQFGTDASSEMVVSWHTLQPVRRARVLLGLLDGKLEQTVEAKEGRYTDAKSGEVVYAYHAKLARLQADTAYLYAALHEGAEPKFGTSRTAPSGVIAMSAALMASPIRASHRATRSG